jgi:hypothetical protein
VHRYSYSLITLGRAPRIRERLSALGQKQTFRNANAMSAFPPKADIDSRRSDDPLRSKNRLF